MTKDCKLQFPAMTITTVCTLKTQMPSSNTKEQQPLPVPQENSKKKKQKKQKD
jgi:hypothetical protein